MEKSRIYEIVNKLLAEVEEEEIGISLLSTYHGAKQELEFFAEEDRTRIMKHFKRLSDDSKRHKELILEIIDELTEKAK